MTLTKLGLTLANLSILKTGKARPIRRVRCPQHRSCRGHR